MIQTEAFYEALIARKMDLFAGVPDSLLKNLCSCITLRSGTERNIITANEGNAIGIACGYHVSSGHYGVVYMQNSGLGNTVNPLLSLADRAIYKIPMLLIIGWRGEPGVKDEPQHVTQGRVTPALLDAMEIKYEILEDDFLPQLDRAAVYMAEEAQPFALIVRKNTFDSFAFKAEKVELPLSREEALDTILQPLTDRDFIVSTTGKTSRELFELREAKGQGHSNDFLTVGGMGHTSSIALGMAIGSEQDIFCIDGDGSFLMHMGAFAVTGQTAPDNFKYILINNGAHESVGGQPTVAFSIRPEEVLTACGFEKVITARSREEILAGMEELRRGGKRALIVLTRQGSRDDLGRPTVSPSQNKTDMMERFAALR